MRNLLFVLVFLAVSLAFGCDADILPDVLDPRLPAYSEEGLGSAGAIVNEGVWSGNGFSNLLIENYLDSDSILIGFTGGTYLPDTTDLPVSMDFHFSLKGLGISDTASVDKLRNKFLELNSADRKIIVSLDGTEICQAENSKGRLNIFVANDSIFAGTFYFEIPTVSNCPELKAYYGRFDYRTRYRSY